MILQDRWSHMAVVCQHKLHCSTDIFKMHSFVTKIHHHAVSEGHVEQWICPI